MSVCSRLSNWLELMGISGVWNGFFITASESAVSFNVPRKLAIA